MCLHRFGYRIGSIKAPVLITTPPNQNIIRTPVKNEYWNNMTPSQIEPHARTKYIIRIDWLLQPATFSYLPFYIDKQTNNFL